MDEPAQHPCVSVELSADKSDVIEIEITGATAEICEAAFSNLIASPAVHSARLLRKPHATADGYVLFGRAQLTSRSGA